MKEHLRDYFPERFENSEMASLSRTVLEAMTALPDYRRRKRCEMVATLVFEQSNELKLLAGAMKKYGCNFNLERHVACETCHKCYGSYDPETNQIVLCSNQYLSQNRVMTLMMHEMVHMFDYCRAQFDFNNLEHVACSEIRAANLVNCSTISDRFKYQAPKQFAIKKTHQICVKNMAFQSIKAYSPETDDITLWSIVDKVFLRCYNDLEPIGRRPTGGMKPLKHSFRERYHYGYLY